MFHHGQEVLVRKMKSEPISIQTSKSSGGWAQLGSIPGSLVTSGLSHCPESQCPSLHIGDNEAPPHKFVVRMRHNNYKKYLAHNTYLIHFENNYVNII